VKFPRLRASLVGGQADRLTAFKGPYAGGLCDWANSQHRLHRQFGGPAEFLRPIRISPEVIAALHFQALGLKGHQAFWPAPAPLEKPVFAGTLG